MTAQHTLSKQDIFNLIASAALLKLADEFPDPVDLNSGEVARPIIEKIDDYEEQFRILAETARNTIQYLADESLIRYRKDQVTWDAPDVFPRAVLTAKGHRVLGSTPEVVDESKEQGSYLDRLADAVEKGNGGLAAWLIRQVAQMVEQ